MKNIIRRATRTPAFAAALRLLEGAQGDDRDYLRVLTYHRVDERDANPHLSISLLSATPADFEVQMRFIATYYHPVTVDEVLAAFAAGVRLPQRSIMVTFDDAYRDFVQHALPALQRWQIPVALFVPTNYPDQPHRSFWWDRLYNAFLHSAHSGVDTPLGTLSWETQEDRVLAFKQVRQHIKSVPHDEAMALVDSLCETLAVPPHDNPILSWDELRSLHTKGVTLGAHTRTHPLINRVSVEQAREEVLGSLQDLQEAIGKVPRIFAYPSGGISDEVVAMLSESDMELAFTTVRGINDLRRAHPLRLRRIDITHNTSLGLLRAQILRHAALFHHLASA